MSEEIPLANDRAALESVIAKLKSQRLPQFTTQEVDEITHQIALVSSLRAENTRLKKQAEELQYKLREITEYAACSDTLTIADAPEKCAFNLVLAMVHNRDLEIARLKKRQLPEGWHVAKNGRQEIIILSSDDENLFYDIETIYFKNVIMYSRDGKCLSRYRCEKDDLVEIDGEPTEAGKS